MYNLRCFLFGLNGGLRCLRSHFKLWLFLISDSEEGITVKDTFWEWMPENYDHFLNLKEEG